MTTTSNRSTTTMTTHTNIVGATLEVPDDFTVRDGGLLVTAHDRPEGAATHVAIHVGTGVFLSGHLPALRTWVDAVAEAVARAEAAAAIVRRIRAETADALNPTDLAPFEVVGAVVVDTTASES